MDAAVTLALLGAVAGFCASALPGFHVNTLAILLLAAAPQAGAGGVAFLVAALAASPFGLALSSTFLGGSSDESALSSLPAHAMAREGRGVEAVALQAWGALLGMLLALPLAFAMRGLLVPLAPRLPALMPWLLLGIVVLLVASESARPAVHARRVVVPWRDGTRLLRGPLSREPRLRVGRALVEDPHGLLEGAADGEVVEARVETLRVPGALSPVVGRALAVGVLLLSGALGWAAFRLGAASPFGLPASPLLPLLAGLFAAPELLDACRRTGRAPAARLGAPRVRLRELLRPALPGAAASSALGLAPGLSGSHAALLAPRSRTPEQALVTLAAVNGGAVVFTLLAWHALGKARSGALVAAQQYAAPAEWSTLAPPVAVLREAALVVLAASAACLLARALSRPVARSAASVGASRLALGGLVLLAGAVAAFTGWLGLLVLAVAALVGLTTKRAGVRRSHAMGVILVPALLRAWSIA